MNVKQKKYLKNYFDVKFLKHGFLRKKKCFPFPFLGLKAVQTLMFLCFIVYKTTAVYMYMLDIHVR